MDLARLREHRPRTEVRRELGLAAAARVVGLVARLDHWGKGHREFFSALAALPERYPVEALIIGGGRREAEMRRLATELGLAGRVHFLGQRDDVPDLLSALDLFVLPSHSEGVSLALLEAMAAGLPVIASRVGGLPEVVTDGENGLLIPPQDPQALATALERLLADPDLAQKLGANARRHVEENYSLERLGREINEIYAELISEIIDVADSLSLPACPLKARAVSSWGRASKLACPPTCPGWPETAAPPLKAFSRNSKLETRNLETSAPTIL